MARFYLDNDVSIALTARLNWLGHDAITARDHDASHAGDYEQLLIATELQRVCITHNERHFRDLHAAWRLWLPHFGVEIAHAGIVVIPQPPRTRRINMAAEIDELILRRVPLTNTLWLWSSVGAWDEVEPRILYY